MPSLREQLEPFFSQALEGVRRSPRLESAATEHPRARLGYRAGRLQKLAFGFDGTRSRDDDEFIAADLYVPNEELSASPNQGFESPTPILRVRLSA